MRCPARMDTTMSEGRGRPRFSAALFVVVCLAMPIEVLGQDQDVRGRLEGNGTLSLTVTDEESGGPVAGAEVSLPELGVSAETNESGEASLSGIPPGLWLVTVAGLGYGGATSFIDFDGESTVEGEVALAEGPIALDEIVVTAEAGSQRLQRMGFYQRRTAGIGRFLDRAAIEEENPTIPSDLFRAMAGFERVEEMDEPGVFKIANRRGSMGFGLDLGPDRSLVSGLRAAIARRELICFMDLYVDGAPYESGIIDHLNVDWVEAIEVFRVSEVPAQYNRAGSSNCGVILVWTRR